MAAAPETFWEDLAEDLKDPEFLRAYLAESSAIVAAQLLASLSRSS